MAALRAALQQAEQYIASGRPDRAAQLLIPTFKSIQQMGNFSYKVDLLEQLVVSTDRNNADISPLEQLTQAMPRQDSPVTSEVLVAASNAAQTLSRDYSVSKTRMFTVLANYATQLERRDLSVNTLNQALAASRFIQGAEFKTIALSNIAEAYLDAGSTDRVAPTLAQSLQSAEAIDSPDRFAKTFALERIANLYARISQTDRALEIVESIPVANYSFATRSTLVNWYSETAQVDRALELLQTFQPDEKAALLAAIAGKLTATQPDRASALYAEAVSTQSSIQNNQDLLKAVVRYVEAGGSVAVANETVQAMDNATFKVPALGVVAFAYAKAGQDNQAEALLAQALVILASISGESDHNRAAYQLIEQAVESGRDDYLRQIIQTIQADGKAPFLFGDRLARFAEQAIAVNRYDTALEITRQISPDFEERRNHLFLEIARGVAQGGAFERVQEIAQAESSNPSLQSKILAVVAAQSLLAEQPSDSTPALFDRSIQIANSIENLPTRAETIAVIAFEHLRANQPDEATQRLNQVIAIAQMIEDVSDRSFLLQSITRQLTLAGEYRAALQVVAAIPDSSTQPFELFNLPDPSTQRFELFNLINEAVKSGDFDIVATAFDQLDGAPIAKTQWLMTVADQYQQLGDRSQAANTLNKALQTAQTIQGRAFQTFDFPGNENPTIVENDFDQDSFLEAIALTYAQIGLVDQALETAQMLKDPGVQNLLIESIRCYEPVTG